MYLHSNAEAYGWRKKKVKICIMMTTLQCIACRSEDWTVLVEVYGGERVWNALKFIWGKYYEFYWLDN